MKKSQRDGHRIFTRHDDNDSDRGSSLAFSPPLDVFYRRPFHRSFNAPVACRLRGLILSRGRSAATTWSRDENGRVKSGGKEEEGKKKKIDSKTGRKEEKYVVDSIGFIPRRKDSKEWRGREKWRKTKKGGKNGERKLGRWKIAMKGKRGRKEGKGEEKKRRVPGGFAYFFFCFSSI